jgi:hypothetical protein
VRGIERKSTAGDRKFKPGLQRAVCESSPKIDEFVLSGFYCSGRTASIEERLGAQGMQNTSCQSRRFARACR